MLGGGPLAAALVRHVAGPVVWLGRTLPAPGPWLSRRIDPGSGEGVRNALRGLRGLIAVLEPGDAVHGLVVVARAEAGLPVALVGPCGGPWPEGVEGSGWARLAVGLAWGPGEPLFDRWSAGWGPVRVGDPGPVPVAPMRAVIEASVALLSHPGAHWRWGGEVTTFPRLAGSILGEHLVRRAWLPGRWAGSTPELARLRSWVGRPGGLRETPGWDPEPVASMPPVE